MTKKLTFVLIALVVFIDKATKKIIQPGALLQTDDLARVNDLVKRGLCSIKEVETSAEEGANGADLVEIQGNSYPVADVKAALSEIGAGVNANAGVKGVTNKVAALSEEELAKLQEKLNNITE